MCCGPNRIGGNILVVEGVESGWLDQIDNRTSIQKQVINQLSSGFEMAT